MRKALQEKAERRLEAEQKRRAKFRTEVEQKAKGFMSDGEKKELPFPKMPKVSGIVFEAYSPLGNPGQLKQDNLDRSVLDHPDIVEISKKHSVTAAQVCISFALHRGLVVIPKSITLSRIVENFKSVDVQLDAEDMKKLREMDKGMRLLEGAIFYTKGQTCDEFWDVEADEKFEVKQPEAKKQKTGEDE